MAKKLTLREARALLLIDKDELDTALVRQSQMFYTVSEIYARKLDEREAAQDAYDQAYAAAAEKVRKSKTEQKKPTEAEIKQAALRKNSVVRAKADFNEAKRIAREWEWMKEAWSQRSFMVGKLCDLYAANYYVAETKRNRTESD